MGGDHLDVDNDALDEDFSFPATKNSNLAHSIVPTNASPHGKSNIIPYPS